jgi:mRNA-degrading endonuclease toxin of MazEF toxin-antitoxin module
MKKDYREWMPVKATINNNPKPIGYKVGDIYWVSIGDNIGWEQDGKGELFTRPVLVIAGFTRNLFWGIPLTTNVRTGSFYFDLGEVSGKSSVAILPQLRAFDVARVSGSGVPLGHVAAQTIKLIRSKLKEFL